MTIIDNLKSKEGFISLQGVDEKLIIEAEEKLKLSFSSEYKEYVKAYGAASFMNHELTGVGVPKPINVVDVTLQEREAVEVPKTWYVIEQTHYDDIVFWQSTKGSVYRTKPGTRPKKVSNSLVEYLEIS